MSTPTCPDSCPKCGSRVVLAGDGVSYNCGTRISPGNTATTESHWCLTLQRDQLLQKLQRLEETRTQAAANSLANMLSHEESMERITQLHAEVDDYMSKATAWKMYADRLEMAGDTLATVTIRNGRSHEQWHKAKETKP